MEGFTTQPMFFVGCIEDINDPRLEGRVKVRAFGIHGLNSEITTEELPWATVIHGDYNPNVLPYENDWVIGFFLDGREAQQPMVLGLLPTQMTEPVDPEKNGWGVIPPENARLRAAASTPENIGQPRNSRLHRGENIEETYVRNQETNRVLDVKGAEGAPDWDEPTSAYNTEYPFNTIYESAKHRIELDDTKDASRIMIHHASGSFIQIDDNGVTVNKSVGDTYEVTEGSEHKIVGATAGFSTVTINGNAYVKVNGNKTEEITGDLQTLVHGNYLLSVAKQANVNAGTQLQMRAADVLAEANQGTFALKSADHLMMQADNDLHIKGKYAWLNGTEVLNLKGKYVYEEGTDEIHLNTGKMFQTSSSEFNIKGDAILKVSSSGTVSIKGTTTYIDDIVRMAEAGGTAPTAASNSVDAANASEYGASQEIQVDPTAAAVPDLPEPVDEQTPVNDKSPGSTSSVGYASTDDSSDEDTENSAPPLDFNAGTGDDNLLATIIRYEGFDAAPRWDVNQWTIGYGSFAGGRRGDRSVPPTITSVTEAEALDLLKIQLSDFIGDVESANRRGGFNWNKNQRDALTSFHYNTGAIFKIIYKDGKEENGYRTTEEIGEALELYNKARTGPILADGSRALEPLKGLTNRRKLEQALFNRITT